MFDLNQFAKEVHENAVAHGFWEGEKYVSEVMSLIHSEWSEALEEYRAGREAVYEGEGGKPEGWAIELIDGCIRILDYIGHVSPCDEPYSITDATGDINDWFRGRSVPDAIHRLHLLTAHACSFDDHSEMFVNLDQIYLVLKAALAYVEGSGLDPEALLRKKHDYNKTRPYRHGKKF